MTIDIDGFRVLGAIAARPEIFASLRVEVSDVARGLINKRLKDKSLTVQNLVDIANALGHENFDLVVDNLSDAEVKTIVGRVDKSGLSAKVASAIAQRTHLSQLAKAEVAPSPQAEKAPIAPKPPKPAKTTLTRAGADGKFTRAKPKTKGQAG